MKLINNSCFQCGFESDKFLCDNCLLQIEFIKSPKCEVCSLPLKDSTYCRDCKDNRMLFRKCIAVASYKGLLRQTIHDIKFRKKIAYIGILNQLQTIYIPLIKLIKPDILLPVPFNFTSFIERGFDLPLELAKDLSKAIHIPLNSRGIVRKISRAQRFLTKEDRKNNLADCFIVRDKDSIRFKRILIIDDIMSTGSTLNELTRTALISGAREVYAFVIGRSIISQSQFHNFLRRV